MWPAAVTQQAEFATDLWQMYPGEGTDEYKNPGEFFRRTYFTKSLKCLLVGAVQRLTRSGGGPVVGLPTNFSASKTHYASPVSPLSRALLRANWRILTAP